MGRRGYSNLRKSSQSTTPQGLVDMSRGCLFLEGGNSHGRGMVITGGRGGLSDGGSVSRRHGLFSSRSFGGEDDAAGGSGEGRD